MTLTEEQIERIVAEVVRRLRSMDHAPSEKHQITLGERLVTVTTLENRFFPDARRRLPGVAKKRLERINEICVGPTAVVTPAAKDWIQEHGARLTRLDV